MAGRLELTPSPLQLFGGPHQQPIGTLSAIDAATGKAWTGTLAWSCSDPEFVFEPHGASASVGSYRPGTATVTAKDAAAGQSARASVQVAIMDGGMPGMPGGRP